jgi:S-adenosylmethionine hydrolase
VLDITRNDFEAARKGRNFTIVIKSQETITRISTHYAGMPEGSKVAFFNAAGHLEIAINKGRAASLLGLHTFAEKANQPMLAARRYYQRVRIYFT